MSFGGLYYPAFTPGFGSKPRFQTTHPFRNLVAAGTNMNNQWSGDSGNSGYGLEPPDYDYHSGPPAHVPSGGSYSHQATTGTGYGPPAQPVHPPAKPSTGGGGVKKGSAPKRGSSATSALTLLSFLFFINLLQGCIKDHMDAMNPTAMVMTTNVIRNRFNKMGEMNSREQNSPSFSSNSVAIKRADLGAAAAAQPPAVMEAIQTPYSVNSERYNTPMQVPAQPLPSYVQNIPEADVPVNYAKPYYDPYQPDPYENHKQQLQPQSSVVHGNYSLNVYSPPNKGPQLKHHYNYHHTEYHAQPSPSVIQQYTTTTHFPHYEYQHPPASNPYNEDNIPQYTKRHEHKDSSNNKKPTDHHHTQNHHTNLQNSQNFPNSQNAYPWSSQSSSSSSVLSGPFRRASIISVSPATKWITLPAKINDHTNFEEVAEEEEEIVEHHNDREIFHSRLN